LHVFFLLLMHFISSFFRACFPLSQIRRSYLFSIILFFVLGFSDLVNAGSLHRLRFDHFSVDQGLPSTGIMKAYQTRDGYIWIATANGLVKYDGRHMQIFSHDPINSASLSQNRVYSLYEDSHQQLWVSTRSGIDRINLKTDVVKRFPNSVDVNIQNNVVFGIAPAEKDQLWLATSNGLTLFDMASGKYRSWESDAFTSTLFVGEVRALLSDGNGGVWIGQGQRVAHIDQSGRLLIQFLASKENDNQKKQPVEMPENIVRSLAFDNSGRLWVGMTGGLGIWQFENSNVISVAMPKELRIPNVIVTSIIQDQEKNMWLALGSNQGLFRWLSKEKKLENFINIPSVFNSLSGNSLTSLMQDNTGGLWIGTSDFGIDLVDLKGKGFNTYLHVPGDPKSISSGLVSAVIPGQFDYLWLGTLGTGLNRLQISTGETERFTTGQVGVDYIRALFLDDNKQLWVGGERLSIFDPIKLKSKTLILDPNFPVGERITSFCKDNNDNVWVGSSFGLYRINKNGVIKAFRSGLKTEGSLNDDAIDSLLFDSQKRLWVGTKGGLFIFNDRDERFYLVGKPSRDIVNPEKLSVTSLREDVHGKIWAATFLGLLEVKPIKNSNVVPSVVNEWELISWANIPNLPDDVIESMQDTEAGDIWLASERGLMHVNTSNKTSRNFPSFGRFEGAFNFGAATRVADGGMFFGGVGLVYFHPSNIRNNSLPPKTVVSDILLFNKSLMNWNNRLTHLRLENKKNTQSKQEIPKYNLKSIGIEGTLSTARKMYLNHDQSMVSFELSALHFYNRTHHQFAWKLDGYDKNWIYSQSDRGIATYTNLAAGTYYLLGRSANSDGVWSESESLLEIVVAPPFWETWWWYGGWILLIIGLLIFFYKRRVKSIQLNQLYLEQQVRLQTKEALEQKKIAEIQREIAERARHDIGRLSEVGLQITASLDVTEILDTLYANIRALVPASTIGVGFVDWDNRKINFEHTLQGDFRILPYSRSLDAADQPATQCVLSGKELIVDEISHDSRKLDAIIAKEVGKNDIQLENGTITENSRSGIYVPMILSGQVMGLIGVLSMKPHGYSLDDLNILRTLASYTAVAYDNADAYRRLKQTQSKLVEQEKLAALGSLVAGVAHELNTPIGNSVLMASTMQDMSNQFLQKVLNNQLRRSDLEKFCENTSASSDLMLRNLTNAANLVSSFKQIAVDQTSDQRRTFYLLNFCEEVALTLSNRVKRDGHELVIDVEAGLELDSFPGPLGQVLSNLIINAIVHGLHEHEGGEIRINGKAHGTSFVLLTVEDNGTGIAKENIDRIFEPFFTTRLGKGGSGLGLHISYNMINSVLGGSIKVESTAGKGTRFTMIIPKVAPLK
jgi:ligand-binding sensor domain-containing protein/signal transduction histidine kinase